MSRVVEVLDRVAKSDDAVFAFDGNDLVILWNKACERMLGRPAYQVLGRHCYDVLCGRDVFGNRYCSRSCPVTSQTRTYPEDPVQNFLMDVPMADGETKRVAVTTFAIRAEVSSLTTIVHVLREPDAEASALEGELAEAARDQPSRRPRARPPGADTVRLTDREQQILRCMAQGQATVHIAKTLFISPVTVRNHIAKILSKLDVHTKLAAVALAYREGLVGPVTRELPVHGAPWDEPDARAARVPAQAARRAAPRKSQGGRPPRAR